MRLAALLLLLAGCAAMPSPPPPAVPPPALSVAGAAGPLALSRWAPEGPPRALTLALHGFGDYAETTWPEAAEAWAARGIEVWAYDQRGFGRNASNRDWPGPEALIADLSAVAAEARRARPGLPLFVVGHSMGGAVALAAAGEGRLDADAVALLAPAVWGGDALPAVYRASAWVASGLIPDRRFGRASSPRPIRPSDNDAMLRAMAGDPLRFADPSPRELMGLIRLMDRAVAAAPSATTETLVVVGANDQIIPEASVRAVYEVLPGPRRWVRAENGWHMLLRDLEAAEVHRLLGDWMLERAG